MTGSYYDGRNFLYLIWKNYPGPLLRRNWRLILRAQLTITQEALRAWRGEAARPGCGARLRACSACPHVAETAGDPEAPPPAPGRINGPLNTG